MDFPKPPDLKGVANLIRTIHSSLGLVALVFILLFFAIPIFLFAPIASAAKYIFVSILLLLGVGVWHNFWSHAKQWPPPVTERWFLALLEQSWGTERKEVSSPSQVAEPSATGTTSVSPPPPSKLMIGKQQ